MAAFSDEELAAYIDAGDGESFFDLVVETFMQSGLTWDHIPDPIVDECIAEFVRIVRVTNPSRLPLEESLEESCIDASAAWLIESVRKALGDESAQWSVWLSGKGRKHPPSRVSSGELCADAVQRRRELRVHDRLEIGVYPDGEAPWETNSLPRRGLHRLD